MRRIERVKKVLRLSGLMLLGAAVGWIIFGELLFVYVCDFQCVGEWCTVTGTAIGMGIGLTIEWLIRLRER